MVKLLRHQFTFYESFFDALRDLPDEQFGRIVRGVCEYSLYGDEPSYNDPTSKMAWKLIRPILQKGRNMSRDQKKHNSRANEAQNVRNSSQCHLKEVDIKEDKEDKEEGETTTKNSSCSSAASGNDNYEKFRLFYNSQVEGTLLSKILTMTQQRKDALDAAKAAVGGEKIMEALAKAKESDYLMGWKDENRRMSVDWFLKPDNIVKILEGNYDNV